MAASCMPIVTKLFLKEFRQEWGLGNLLAEGIFLCVVENFHRACLRDCGIISFVAGKTTSRLQNFQRELAVVAPATLPVAGYVGGFARVLNFDEVSPGIGLAAVEIGEAVDLRQLSAGQRLSVPARHVGILRERRHRPADERRTLGDGEVGTILVASRQFDSVTP